MKKLAWVVLLLSLYSFSAASDFDLSSAGDPKVLGMSVSLNSEKIKKTIWPADGEQALNSIRMFKIFCAFGLMKGGAQFMQGYNAASEAKRMNDYRAMPSEELCIAYAEKFIEIVRHLGYDRNIDSMEAVY